MDEQRDYARLFSPIEIGGKRLRNRIVHAAILTRLAVQGAVSERLIEHTLARARGGAAMIVTEPLGTSHRHNEAIRVACWNDDGVEGLKRWADAIEGADCRLVGQIQDSGRGRRTPGRNFNAIGASSLPDDLSWTVPYALATDEVEAMIAEIAQSSRRLKQCGFSGVEISAGHGHLFHQFLSPWSNNREDKYGGDFDGRLRIVAELIDAIVALCGNDFMLGLKLPGDDGIAGSIGPDLSGRIAAQLTASGKASYVAFAQGTHNRTLEMHAPDSHYPAMAYMPLYRQLRPSVTGIPLMALGRITDPAEADGIVARGEADLIGLGRPLLTDAGWVNKAASGRARDIRYCVSGNKCWKNNTENGFLACENNPLLAEGMELKPPARATVPKTVVVVGAGIAGLEAALAAAERGHQVTVIGRSSQVGGSTRLQAQLPGSEQMSSIYDYQFMAAGRASVRFELGVDASAADVIAMRPDIVLLATGSRMIWPRCLPQDLQASGLILDLRKAMVDVIGRKSRQSGTAVIFDMDATEGTYAAAELLQQRFERAILLTPRDSIAQETSVLARQSILRRFHTSGMSYVVLSEPRWTDDFEQGRLTYQNVYSGKRDSIDNVAFFAYSTPRAPNVELAAPLREAGLDVRLIGDCRVARDALAATSDGYSAGRSL